MSTNIGFKPDVSPVIKAYQDEIVEIKKYSFNVNQILKLTQKITTLIQVSSPQDLKKILSDERVEILANKWADTEFKQTKKFDSLLIAIQKVLDQIAPQDGKTTASGVKKPVAQRLQEHNLKASNAAKLLESPQEEFSEFIQTRQKKQELDAKRVPVSSFAAFNDGTFKNSSNQILTESLNMQGCEVDLACSIGERKSMEDRYVADSFQFTANGVMQNAQVFGVFDGHNGSSAVEFVSSNIVERIKGHLELRLKNKNVNDDDIFYALQEAVSGLHEDIIKNKQHGSGTTAVIAFKLANSNSLWTANIGDSRAYLNHKGKLIPMSIDQKPYFTKGNPSSLNEYALQLLKKGVEINQNTGDEVDAVKKEGKMFLSFINEQENRFDMRLGLTNLVHFDMTRSIGSSIFDKWKKHTPEIFRRILVKGDQLIMHSDGVDAGMNAVVKAVQADKEQGFKTIDTATCLVEASIPAGDNVTALIVSF